MELAQSKADRSRIALLALCRANSANWSLIAREAARPDGLERLIRGEITERRADSESKRRLKVAIGVGLPIREIRQDLDTWRAHDRSLRLTTVLDDDYPLNLLSIYNLPPFLFYRGRLKADDALSVAVVGTRAPSRDGIRRAIQMASGLAKGNVTVLSGLALGIDTAAHTASLKAGGRTIAVLGSGLFNVYPKENSKLAGSILDNGVLVSQFWPDTPPRRYNFPLRNVVTSGLGQGTVVIEASATSGAKMQARLAVEHGKKVFLLRSLIETYAWAQRYLGRPGVYDVSRIDEVLDRLQSPDEVKKRTISQRCEPQQLAWAL